jgi:hypothetical protein
MNQHNGHADPTFMHLMVNVESPDVLSAVHYAGQFRPHTVFLDTHSLHHSVVVTCAPAAGGQTDVTITARRAAAWGCGEFVTRPNHRAPRLCFSM